MAAKKVVEVKAKNKRNLSASLQLGPIDPQPPSAMIYSLGDSWFTYPTIFDQGAPINLIRALDAATQPHGTRYFLNEHGKAGATSDDLTTGDYLDDLTQGLGDEYDFLLLSMGGNDFVGTNTVDGKVITSFGNFLVDYDKQTQGKDLLNQQALSARMDQTLANYQKVFRLCEATSANQNLAIVAHVYDFPLPTDRGARVLNRWQVLGPWMYTDLVKRNIPKKLWPAVARAFLEQFSARLNALAVDLNTHTQTGIRLLIADTQGTLPALDPDYWINEIHPKNIGYELLIKKFEEIIDPIRDSLAPAKWRNWPKY